MATDDDDLDLDLDLDRAASLDSPDAEPTAAELAHAKAFAALVEQSLVGTVPAAMAADDRALLEIATVIRAANGKVELSAASTRSLVDDVLRQAVGERPAGSSVGKGTVGAAVVAITSARVKRRWLPWTVAGASTAIAAAAVAMLWLGGPARGVETVVEREAPPAAWTSRPTDPLIGQIPRERAGAASTRIDRIFDDRLDGYRERRMTKPRGIR